MAGGAPIAAPLEGAAVVAVRQSMAVIPLRPIGRCSSSFWRPSCRFSTRRFRDAGRKYQKGFRTDRYPAWAFSRDLPRSSAISSSAFHLVVWPIFIPRKFVLAASAAVTGVLIALSGIAQSFGQFVGSRVFLAAGGSAHAPAVLFAARRCLSAEKTDPRLCAVQFGFIGGTTLGAGARRTLVRASGTWENERFSGDERL